MERTKKGRELAAQIMSLAATSDGFKTTDSADCVKNAQKKCQVFTADGRLVKVAVNHKNVRYFASRELADAYILRCGGVYTAPVLSTKKKSILSPAPVKSTGRVKAIIDSPNVKRTFHPFIDLRAVIVPVRRIGTPGWFAPIGEGA